MKFLKIAVCAAVALIFILIFTNVLTAPSKQELRDAFISVKADKLHRNKNTQNLILSEQKNKIENVVVYTAKKSNINYTVTYVKYKSSGIRIATAIPVIARIFQNTGFTYETHEFSQGETKGIIITGTYILEGIEYGVMGKFLKHENNFWQALVIYQNSERNAKTAENFINSVTIKLEI